MKTLHGKTMIFFLRLYLAAKNRLSRFAPIVAFRRLLHSCYLTAHGVEVEYGSVRLVGFPLIKKCKNSRIILGKGVSLISKSEGNPAGINHPVILATLAEGAIIKISDGCGLSGSSICAVKMVKIGKNTGFGANSHVYDTDFHSVESFRFVEDDILEAKFSAVSIGENVWIGANSLVLKGVSIGDNTVVAAGSVVRHSVPGNSVAAGNPAKIIRRKEDTP